MQANHRLYTDYHERILKAVDTCLPVEKVMSIDEMACRLMGTERQVPVARELALKVKRALREQVGECLTCSIGIAPNVFLGKVGSDLQKPDGLVVITQDNLPEVLLGLELQDIYGIGKRMEQRLHRAGIFTVAELWKASPFRLRRVWGGINGLLFHQMLHGVDIQPPSSRFAKSIGHQHVLEPELRTNERRREFRAAPADQGGRAAAARRLLLPPARPASVMGRRSRRLVGRNQFQRDARHRLSARAASTSSGRGSRAHKPLSVGVVLLDLVPAARISRICSTPTTRGARNCRR